MKKETAMPIKDGEMPSVQNIKTREIFWFPGDKIVDYKFIKETKEGFNCVGYWKKNNGETIRLFFQSIDFYFSEL